MEHIKEKNPYFKPLIKSLIDMFILKKHNSFVSLEEEDTFLELIYTNYTKNPYRISYGFLMGNESNYFEKYYYSKLNKIEMTRDLNETIKLNLNLEALNYIGINLSDLKNMSTKELEQAKKKAYNYFEVDATDTNREELLQNKLHNLKVIKAKPVTSGNGYVDILLLMSIIITTLSVLSIIFLSFR